MKITNSSGGFPNLLADGDRFGRSVASIGDVNGDMVGDLAVGASLDDQAGTNNGAVWILFMNADGTVSGQQKITEGVGGFTANLDTPDRFGITTAPLGDLDGDSVPDLAVGAPFDDDAGSDTGAVYILFLNSNGTVKAFQKITEGIGGFTGDLDPGTPGDRFGLGMGSIGDLAGNGWTDIAVGAPGDDDAGADAGAVWVVFLRDDGTVIEQLKITEGAASFTGDLDAGDEFGRGPGGLGDVNGDSVPDLLVGTQFDDDGDGADSGAAWMLFLNGIVVPTACIPAPDDLVGWWPGDGNASDIASGLNGTLNGGATATATGVVDRAFDLNGTTSEVLVESDDSLNVQAFTIDAWVRPTAFNYIVNMIVNKEEAFRSPRQYEIGIRGPDPPTGPNPIPVGNLIFEIGTPAFFRGTQPDDWGWYDSYASVPLGEWTHVALTFDNSTDTAITYVNGLATRVISDYGGDIPDTSGPFRIGARDDADPAFVEKFTGQIDEVEFFDRALTACEIQQIYLAGAFGKCKAGEPVFPDEVCENLTTPVTLDLMPTEEVTIDGTPSTGNILSSFPPPFTVPPWDPLPELEPVAPTPEGPVTGTPDITFTPPTGEGDGLSPP